MNKSLKADVFRRLADWSEADREDFYFELQIFFLVRECVNRIGLGAGEEVGRNGGLTGVDEYEGEVYRIYSWLLKNYADAKSITKDELFAQVKIVWAEMFFDGAAANDDGRRLADSIYNELYKLENPHDISARRKKVGLPLGRYANFITTRNEYVK